HRIKYPLTYTANIDNLRPLLSRLTSCHLDLDHYSKPSKFECLWLGNIRRDFGQNESQVIGKTAELSLPWYRLFTSAHLRAGQQRHDVRRLFLRRCLCLANDNRLEKYRLRRD